MTDEQHALGMSLQKPAQEKNVLWWYLNKAFFQRMLSLRANTGNFFSSVQDKRKEDQEEVK